MAALPLDLGSRTTIPHSLAVAGGWAGNPRLNLISDPLGTASERLDRAAPGRVVRGARALYASTQPEGYSFLVRGSSKDEFHLQSTASGATLPLLDNLTSLPAGVEYLHGNFDGARMSFLFYVPGSAAVLASFAETAGRLATPTSHDAGAAVQSVHLIRKEGRDSLAILFMDGTIREFAFDGTQLRPGATLPVPAGTHPSAVLGYGDDLLVLLTAVQPGAPSDAFHHFRYDGRLWTPGTSGTLPTTGAVSSTSNLLLYDRDPILDERAEVVKVIRIPDWTSDVQLSGAQLTVVAERFQSTATGLGAGTVFSLGSPPPGATYGLANQVRKDASLVSAESFAGPALPTITADPPGGTYDESIRIRLLTKNRFATAYYQFAGSPSPPVAYAPLVPIAPPQGTLADFELIFYAQLPDGTRSPLQRARYQFAGAPGTIDSDHDGVPDFVETDPHGGRDTDGDSFTDLEELVLNTDPDDSASTPSAADRPDFESVYDLAIRPLSVAPNGTLSPPFGTSPLAAPASVDVRSPGGALLGNAPTATHRIAGLPDPLALIEGVAAPGGLFAVVATPKRFDVQATPAKSDGREVIALVPVPEILEGTTIPYTYHSRPVAEERDAWIAAARAAYASGRPRIAREITYRDSLALLVMERFLVRELGRRDPSNPEIATLSLTGFRDRGAPGFLLDGTTLSSLEHPGPLGEPAFLLHNVYSRIRTALDDSPTVRVQALVDLARELHRVSAALGDTTPGLYPNPFDTLRDVVQADKLSTPSTEPFTLPGTSATPQTSYASAVNLSPLTLAAAAGGTADLLIRVGERALVSLDLAVVSTTYAEDQPPLLEDVAAPGAQYRLWDADAAPFALPNLFPLPIGSRLAVTGYLDGTFPPGPGTPLEVLTAEVVAIGPGDGADRNGNLLGDYFEEEYFGAGPLDPFADHDGDGYSTLQESLEGSDPTDRASRPGVPAEDLTPPPVDLAFTPGGLALTFDFPEAYDHRIAFSLECSDGLQGYDQTGDVARRSSGRLETTFPLPARIPERKFFRFQMMLR